MRKSIMLGAALVLIAGSALAQAQNPPAKSEPGNSAINSRGTDKGGPVAGRNSFTEGQAKSRIESSGYANVSALKKDDNGIWRGKAVKDGKSTNVSLDFEGNVVAQ